MTRRHFQTALGALAALAALSAEGRGQEPSPFKPNPITEQRSGLITRFTPIRPHLPQDCKRDNWYNTRWANYPGTPHINCLCHGGLYGLRFTEDCTSCTPVFRGTPGNCSGGPKCESYCRPARWYMNVLHPFRPVGYYYGGGCYAPVYDLDPLITGPGPFPWPIFYKRCLGG